MRDTTNNKEIPWNTFSIFEKIGKEDLCWLEERTKVLFVDRGAHLHEEGTFPKGCCFILEGLVKVYQTGLEGREQIIRFAQRGDFVGFRSVINSEKACSGARVLQACRVLYISKDTLYGLLERCHAFSMAFLQMTCRELKESNTSLTFVAQKSVRERVAVALLLLAESFGLDEYQTLKVVLKRDDLANMVGTATESIIRVLKEFKDDKLIVGEGKKIKLIDIPRLRKISNTV